MRHTPSLDIRLTADMPAQVAVATILQALFADIKKNEPGVIRDESDENLHDFRIAVRRTRSALSQLRETLPANEVEGFLQEFNWLGALTGPVRDLDVYLHGFDDEQTMLPAGIREHLLPLKAFLGRSRTVELQKLKQGLGSERYQRLMVDWQGFIAGQLTAAPPMDVPAAPIRTLASHRIDRMYRRVLRQGRRIGPESSDERLHDLRKSCKKLRYLLEFFARIYPEKAVSRQIGSLKKIQDALGITHDLVVQDAWLTDARHAIQQSFPADESVEQAMDLFHKALRKRQGKARKKFIARFGEFDDKRHRRTMRLMLRKKAVPKKADQDSSSTSRGSSGIT